jgi:hypothetical protein
MESNESKEKKTLLDQTSSKPPLEDKMTDLVIDSDSVCCKKKNSEKIEPEDLNQVLPFVYVGSLDAAKNVDLLKKLNIKYVLTVEDNELDEDVQRHFVYKFIKLYDYPSSSILEILEECIQFIDSAVENSHNILIHW